MEQRLSFQEWQSGTEAQQVQEQPQQHDQENFPAQQVAAAGAGALQDNTFPAHVAEQVVPHVPAGLLAVPQQNAQGAPAPPAAPAEAGPSSLTAIQAPGSSSTHPERWLDVLSASYNGIPGPWNAKKVLLSAGCVMLVLTKEAMAVKHQVSLSRVEVEELCKAIEGGQLQQLRSMSVDATQCSLLVARLVKPMAGQLESLSISFLPSCKLLQPLTSMKRFQLNKCHVTVEVFNYLCRLPSLEHVTLDQCTLQSDVSWCDCTWHLLCLRSARLEDIALLPLNGIKEVRLVGGVRTEVSEPDQWAAIEGVVKHVVALNMQKVSCLPGTGQKFIFGHLGEAIVPLIKCLKDVETVVLQSHLPQGDVLQQMYQALPREVNHVCLDQVSGLNWEGFWKHTPEHLVKVTVQIGQHMPAGDIGKMVGATPAHITSVVLACSDWDKARLESYTQSFSHLLPVHMRLTVSHGSHSIVLSSA